MKTVGRRDVLHFAAAVASSRLALPAALAGTAQTDYGSNEDERRAIIEAWMNRWMAPPKGGSRMPMGMLHLSRFKDPTYFLTQSIGWKPNLDRIGNFAPVEVPIGFVTDFASVPRFFWSLLRPDGEYTYPAIIHDYLYWVQSRPRETADAIFLAAMEDFKIASKQRLTIYEAVRDFGFVAWRSNAEAKAQGEKRILRIFPDDPRITWEEWKKRSEVFLS
jgi:hypothetical protein